tara:strand:+ start:734 stop:1240 length:507 start_codon:yes stop_codon:yes gene_type:complete
MERRINKKIGDYLSCYKENIKNKILTTIDGDGDKERVMDIIQYIYDYENVVINEDDFMKRKRTKNMVPLHDRCIALRANGEQCTRRKRNDCEFCGTHMKGSPNGTCENVDNTTSKTKVEIWSQEIQGILYYIDKEGNVYDMNDIMRNEKSPKIILKYEKDGDNYKLLR